MIKASGENCLIICLVSIASCLLHCIENCVDYINKAAYSFIAISGQDFVSGAKDGLLLNLKHGLEFAWAMTLAYGFVWLGKVALLTLNVYTGYILMTKVTGEVNDHTSPVVPLIFIGLIQFVISEIFLGLFDEAVQSLMTCLCVDKDLHDDVPKFGPSTFHDKFESAIEDQKAKRGGQTAVNADPSTQPLV
jgi:choline transporter-like protein 2/4/5